VKWVSATRPIRARNSCIDGLCPIIIESPFPRSINSDPSKRGDVKELVVFNHSPESVRKAAS